MEYLNQKKEIKQNKQPNNGQCCLFIVGISTSFSHAMTFFKNIIEYLVGVGENVQYPVKMVLFSQTYISLIRSSAAVW